MLKCFKHGSYPPSGLRRVRKIGLRHGFNEGSDAIARRRRDKNETMVNDAMSSSPRISAMSSTGRDSKADIQVAVRCGIR